MTVSCSLDGTSFVLHACHFAQEQVVMDDDEPDDEPEQSFVIQSIIKEKRSRCYSTDEPDEDAVEPGNGHAVNRGGDAAARDEDGVKQDEEAAHLMEDDRGAVTDRMASVRSRNPSVKLSRSRNVSVRSVTVVEEKKPMERQVCSNCNTIREWYVATEHCVWACFFLCSRAFSA
jgi:hypothetical protein